MRKFHHELVGISVSQLWPWNLCVQIWWFPKSWGYPKSSFLIGFSINHPFGGTTIKPPNGVKDSKIHIAKGCLQAPLPMDLSQFWALQTSIPTLPAPIPSWPVQIHFLQFVCLHSCCFHRHFAELFIEVRRWLTWWAGPPPRIPWLWRRTSARSNASRDTPQFSQRSTQAMAQCPFMILSEWSGKIWDTTVSVFLSENGDNRG